MLLKILFLFVNVYLIHCQIKPEDVLTDEELKEVDKRWKKFDLPLIKEFREFYFGLSLKLLNLELKAAQEQNDKTCRYDAINDCCIEIGAKLNKLNEEMPTETEYNDFWDNLTKQLEAPFKLIETERLLLRRDNINLKADTCQVLLELKQQDTFLHCIEQFSSDPTILEIAAEIDAANDQLPRDQYQRLLNIINDINHLDDDNCLTHPY